MCLILLAWQVHDDYPLVVAANRDEFFSRPTAPANFWAENPQILAGRDLQAGGTWLGMATGKFGRRTENGGATTSAGCGEASTGYRFAALTNYRDLAHMRPQAPSRGGLVSGFLAGSMSPEAWLDHIQPDAGQYNGFNLILGVGQDLWWYSNVATGQANRRRLGPGVYGVSNHLLDTAWPKLEIGKTALSDALHALPDDTPLFDLLGDTTVHPDHLLPDTGIGLEWERLLSAAFVTSPSYGTRSSTVVLARHDGSFRFSEQTWRPGQERGSLVRFDTGVPT